MTLLDFPESVQKQYAESTRARYQAKIAARRKAGAKGPHIPRIGSQTTENGALCYRMPDGTVRAIYDPYKAQYPKGAVAGRGRVVTTCKAYPNGTHGYERTCSGFEPLEARA